MIRRPSSALAWKCSRCSETLHNLDEKACGICDFCYRAIDYAVRRHAPNIDRPLTEGEQRLLDAVMSVEDEGQPVPDIVSFTAIGGFLFFFGLLCWSLWRGHGG